MMRLTLSFLFVSFLSFAAAVHAGEQRHIEPIRRPSAREKAAAVPASETKRVDPAVVRDGVEKIVSAWNRGNLGDYLADDFYDKSRLTDAIDEQAPRDATLQVLEIGAIQTLEQRIDPERNERVSLVSVTVRAQLEFQDPSAGFVRREGRNELLLRVREPESGEGDR